MPGTESIYVGEFMGTPVSSPNKSFTIAYGAFLDRKDVEDKYYILFRNKREIARGQTNSRIDTATVDDHGNFGLSLIGNMKNDTTIVLFRSNGTEYARFTTDKFLYFFKIVEEGASLFWGVDNAVRKTDIASRTDAFEFSVPHRVYPSDGIIDLENNIVLLKDSDRGYYLFGFDGSFLDFESWFSN